MANFIYLSDPQGEKFSETKKRLQTRIGASDKDLAKCRFALIQVATFKQPSYIEDGQTQGKTALTFADSFFLSEDTIFDHKFAPEDCLGIDHIDKSGRSRAGAGEKGIVMKG